MGAQTCSTALNILLVLTVLVVHVSISESFIRPENYGSSRPYRANRKSPLSAASTTDTTFEPVFDFRQNNTVESFERIDDVIMGGISTSALREVPGQPYASWSGICRLDGG